MYVQLDQTPIHGFIASARPNQDEKWMPSIVTQTYRLVIPSKSSASISLCPFFDPEIFGPLA